MAEGTELRPVTQISGILQAQTQAAAAMVQQKKDISELVRKTMTPGVDFGVIPGTGKDSKPSLLKPGAEKIVMFYGLRPETEISCPIDDAGHMTVFAKTIMKSPDGVYLGDGQGVCSTRETKYAFKRAGLICPSCGAEAIIKGKQEYGGGWVCLKNKGGCGAKFDDKAEEITNQRGQTATNPADFYNTVVKMAQKRSVVAAVLLTTAASSMFTQDHSEGENTTSAGLNGQISPDEAEKIAIEAQEAGVDVEEMLRYFGISDIYGLRAEHLPKIQNEIKRMQGGKGGR